MTDEIKKYTPRKSKKVEVSDLPKIDHTKEEVLVNVGDTTKCGHKVSAIVDTNRVLISNKEGAKVVNKGDIEIV
jgi:hypothetical protein